MPRSLRVSNPRLYATLACSVAVVLLALQAGCGSNARSVFEPLAPTPTGAVIAGSVRAQGGGVLPGVVVTLEAIDGGLSASVYRAMRDVAPAAASLGRGGRLPLVGAPATTTNGRAPSAVLGTPSRSAVTDSRGGFAFAGVASGAYLLTGITQNHQAGTAHADVPHIESSTAVETTFVNISMMPTGKFYGNVTLENATNHQSTIVYVDGTSYLAVTNAAGNYRIEGVPVGTWTVRGTHPGYLDRSTSGSIAAAGDSIPLASFQLPLNSNIPPTAAANAPTSLVTHVPTSFSGSGADDDGTIVRYEWDFENDGTFDYSSPTSASTTHAYPSNGTYVAKLRVTDNQGAIGLDAITFTVTNAVFLSTTGGDANPGTFDQPVATFAQAFSLAASQNLTNVYVATGTYTEAPVFPAGLEIRGGYTSGATWTRTAGNYSIVNVGLSPALASGVSSATLVSGLDIRASNQIAPGASSIAMRVQNSTAALQFTDCKFSAGNGGNANNGSSGVAGSSGSSAGGQGGGVGGIPGGGLGGAGGGGGNFGSGGGNGGNGGNFCGGNSGGFGGSGFSCSPGGGGGNGFPGTNCAPGDGPNGASLTGAGTVVTGVWVPAAGNSGVQGAGGAGGGGGGGGGGTTTGFLCGNNATGGAGGGGGGGGGFGTGGVGGQGGGASFAVFLLNSSPIFSACSFTSKFGGAGGIGGNGGGFGLGANGAGGSAGGLNAGSGGPGALAGRGGGGGGGGGGAGGLTVCVASVGASSPTLTSPSYTVGLGGSAGSGGFNGGTATQAPAGPNGTSAQTLLLPGSEPGLVGSRVTVRHEGRSR